MAKISIMEENLLKLLTKKDKRNKESIFDSETNLHDVTYFHQRLCIERRRAERFKYKFSLVIVDIESFQNLSENKLLTKEMKIFKDIINTICLNIRGTDVISYYEPYKVIILLPDTSKKETKIVVDRLKFQLKDSFSEKFPYNKLPINSLISKIYTYPEDGKDGFEGKFFSTQDSMITKKTKSNRVKTIDSRSKPEKILRSSQQNNIFFTWSRVNFDGVVLALYDPIFFDLGFLSHVFFVLQRIIKRILDIIGTIFCIILFSPLMIGIVIGIKLTSRGPVLFKQKRIGFMGKPFYMLKFRSMSLNSSEKIHRDYIENLLSNSVSCQKNSEYVAKYKAQINRRTTLIGKFLRKTSLDELPQLFNVLWGHMSLVGPRPHPVYEVEKYKRWHYRRMTIKPGMTGFSKVSVRCTPENYDEAMRFDLRYIENWSLVLDLKILLKTIPLVIFGKGAY